MTGMKLALKFLQQYYSSSSHVLSALNFKEVARTST